MVLKIVLDTNVLIDASEDYFRYANRILDLVLANRVQAFANRATIRENKLLAHRKITDEGYLKKLEYFFDAVKSIETSGKLNVVEDREDNKILESAVAAEADYLITSDHHLLKLEKYQGVRIVRPNEFWSIWEEEGEGGWMKWVRSFME